MNTRLQIGVGILAIFTGSLVIHAADPAKDDIIFEGKPLRSWLEERFDPNISFADRHKADDALRRFCAKPEIATPALTAALADKNEDVRRVATIALSYCKSGSAPAIPTLLKILRSDESVLVRVAVVGTLAEFGPRDDVIEALVKTLKTDEDGCVREGVVRALRDMVPKATTVTPALIDALKDRGAGVRQQAALALAEFGEPKKVIVCLIAALNDEDEGVRWAVADSLGALCPEAIPTIRTAMVDENPLVRAGAVRSFGKVAENVKTANCKGTTGNYSPIGR